jgi:hypothetical protein
MLLRQFSPGKLLRPLLLLFVRAKLAAH